MTEGINYAHREGTAGDAPPAKAEEWLAQWRMVGGGITVDRDGLLNPWRFIPAGIKPTARALADSLTDELLKELDETPGLARAVRIAISSTAALQLSRALNDMGKTK